MMRKIRQIISLVFAAALVFVSGVTAYAHEVPDLSRKGTLTVKMEYANKPVSGGTLTAYRVGDVHEDDGNYSFVKSTAMGEFAGDYSDLSSKSLAGEIEAYVKEHNVGAYATAKNESGQAVFSNLEPGLYLIVQTTASDGYKPLTSFLVSMPMNENGHYVYDVGAEGKFELDKAPEPTTPTNPDPTLPQTGQLNWPVPVLAVLGLSLFLVGFILRFGRKETGDAA